MSNALKNVAESTAHVWSDIVDEARDLVALLHTEIVEHKVGEIIEPGRGRAHPDPESGVVLTLEHALDALEAVVAPGRAGSPQPEPPDGEGHVVDQEKMLHDKNAIARLTTGMYRDYFAAQYNQQIMQLQQQLQLAQQLVNEASSQLKYITALIEVNGKLLLTGDVKMADFVIAINSYLAAKNNIIQNTIAKLQIINQINYWDRKK